MYQQECDLFCEVPSEQRDEVLKALKPGAWGEEVSPVFILVYEAMCLIVLREGEERIGSATLEFLRLLRKFQNVPGETFLMGSLS